MVEIPKTNNLHFQRFEFKYLLPVSWADLLIPKLLKYMDWDPYVAEKPTRKYQVASLYYDSAGLACYYEKLAGVEKRKKLRLRTYDKYLKPDSDVYVEIKRKDDAVVLKDRIKITYQTYLRSLAEGNYEELRKDQSANEVQFLDEFIWTKDYNCLMPKVMVIYKRAPLFSKMDQKFRVTFDSNLTAYPADRLDFRQDKVLVNPDFLVMEVKYNNVLPFWFHEIIKDYQLQRISFSKYCMAIDACKNKHLI